MHLNVKQVKVFGLFQLTDSVIYINTIFRNILKYNTYKCVIIIHEY